MLRKINSYLLTNYPLLWNSRITWLIGVNIIVHFFFFLGGLSGITAETMHDHNSFYSVGVPGLIFFSILSSFAVLILWLVFYLRNNAFKSFYIIGKWHSFREFVIIFAAILMSILYFESFFWGVRVKTRMITSRTTFIQEVNTINLAMAFVPLSKQSYFILDSCGKDRVPVYNDNINYFDSTLYNYSDSNFIKIRKALEQGDALSYKNYCNYFIQLDEYGHFAPREQWMATRDRWIDNRQTDSIRYILDQLFAIAKKYDIDYSVTTDQLVKLVFADSNHTVTRIIPSSAVYNSDVPESYFSEYELSQALDFVEGSHLNTRDNDANGRFLIELYVALSLAILLFCYRLYSKKVFLVSIVGAIVWSIVFVLVGTSDHSHRGSATVVFYLFLFAVFLITALALLTGRSNKTITGAVLNWHIHMLPYVLLLTAMLISDGYRNDTRYYYSGSPALTEKELQSLYPVGYWVDHHMVLLCWLNLLFAFLYVSFYFSKLSKKWHIKPEE